MKGNILIIDKDKIFAEGLKYSLEQDGFTIDIIGLGKPATDKILNKTYDLVILELEMPDINGLDICKNIRSISLCLLL